MLLTCTLFHQHSTYSTRLATGMALYIHMQTKFDCTIIYTDWLYTMLTGLGKLVNGFSDVQEVRLARNDEMELLERLAGQYKGVAPGR